MADVVIDTVVVSLLQKGRAPEWVQESISGNRVWLTFVTVGELMKWTVVRRWGETRRQQLDSWISHRPIIPYDRAVAHQWGDLAGAAQLRGRPRPQNDTWIAACCIRQNVPLITLNTADFMEFAEHDGPVLVGAG
jgi:predicted nucleic acid-binding protein